ncbi:hypothetical protein LH447_13900, partial [Laribacter hongkongensis]|uniref:hypothetical protein n=1 Tax=Laribacter hongkongensis TaxID=168471 RepID=UPI001EFCAC68
DMAAQRLQRGTQSGQLAFTFFGGKQALHWGIPVSERSDHARTGGFWKFPDATRQASTRMAE